MGLVLVIEVKTVDLVSQLLMHLQLGVESDLSPENYSNNENRHKNRRFFSFPNCDLELDLIWSYNLNWTMVTAVQESFSTTLLL